MWLLFVDDIVVMILSRKQKQDLVRNQKLKFCNKCKLIKPLIDFYKVETRGDETECKGYAVYCKPCSIVTSKDRRKRNPDSHLRASRRWHQKNPGAKLKERTGIEHEDKIKKLEEQGFKCAICKSDKSGKTPKPDKRDWCADHDHQTGRFRGVLCVRCNVALGLLKDSKDIAYSLHEYLIKNEQQDFS